MLKAQTYPIVYIWGVYDNFVGAIMSEERRINFYETHDGIFVFECFKLDREGADLFSKIVRAGHENPPENMRVLYDFSRAELPTPYFITLQGLLYNEFPHPTDEKSAYIVGDKHNKIWVDILRTRIIPQDKMKIFNNRENALAWLRE